jgi:hypothetical protein
MDCRSMVVTKRGGPQGLQVMQTSGAGGLVLQDDNELQSKEKKWHTRT